MKGAVRQLNFTMDKKIAEKGRAKLLLNSMKRTAGIVLLSTALSLSVFAAKPVMAEPPRKEVAELIAPQKTQKIKGKERTEPPKTVIEEKITKIKTEKIETVEKERAKIPEADVLKISEEKPENSKTNIQELKPYLFWRAPILGNLLYAKYIKYKKYVKIRIPVRIKEWTKKQTRPITFYASKVIPELKRHFPASTVISKKT